MRVLAIPNSHFPPDEDALALADVVLDSLAELTPEADRSRLLGVAAEQDAAVVAAEAHRVRQRHVDLHPRASFGT